MHPSKDKRIEFVLSFYAFKIPSGLTPDRLENLPPLYIVKELYKITSLHNRDIFEGPFLGCFGVF